MRSTRRFVFALIDSLRELVLVARLSLPIPVRRRSSPTEPEFIAGVTSYAGRIKHAWIAIECLLRQSRQPDRLFLVLSEEEFPDHELPWRIRRQLRRGLEILWVSQDGRSFDKLIPLVTNFPEASIITFDDDKYFPKDLVHRLISAHNSEPNHVIGARGWVMKTAMKSASVSYGEGWVRALPGDKGNHLFLPGGNGTLYPPHSLDEGVTDLGRALALSPTADDIWFWAHVQKQGTPMMCLGLPPHRPIKRTSRGSALSHINEDQNTVQLRNVIRALGIDEFVGEQLRAHA